MRLLTLLLLWGFASGALAAQAQPPDLQTLPAPSMDNSATDDDAGVTITRETADKVEEFRVGGRLYMIKVTPKHGQPYYLIDDHGDGKFSRQGTLDSGFRPPQWVIKKF